MKIHTPILSTVERAVQEGMRKAGEATLERARELSPTETGKSDESGFVAVDDLTTQVGFKSFISRIQHENLEYQHPDGGQPKFLETAAAEIDVEQIIARSVREALGG